MTLTLHDFDGEHSLTLTAGDLVADAAVVATGHEPNEYFWEGLVQFAWPDTAALLDFDSEGGIFRAIGSSSDFAQLKAAPSIPDRRSTSRHPTAGRPPRHAARLVDTTHPCPP
ncbi:hypothetical protein [Streptomyces sp. DH37]|uniref:hypothetical protein n=1 Tax=Streptomyces sp. DH37 TaxID=3040122 RepID=UPI002441E9B4|nr:hypothetical protein [Streptomyces sp. DH37]MDG9702900.1 hypothetical protein [Streptomyces sp. DH37]